MEANKVHTLLSNVHTPLSSPVALEMLAVKEDKTLNLSEVMLYAIILNPVFNAWAGTKRLIQAGCHTQNQMDGLPPVEDDIYAKKATNGWDIW